MRTQNASAKLQQFMTWLKRTLCKWDSQHKTLSARKIFPFSIHMHTPKGDRSQMEATTETRAICEHVGATMGAPVSAFSLAQVLPKSLGSLLLRTLMHVHGFMHEQSS